MWWTEEGDRVLTDEEWAVFNTGLDLLRDLVESDIQSNTGIAQADFQAFDDLTAEQKLVLLADVAEALRSPLIPAPDLTAANEAAVAAVFSMFKAMLVTEIDAGQLDPGEESTDLRRLLLAAIGQAEDLDEPLLSESDRDIGEWNFLMEVLEGRVFWDNDFTMGDAFLDLPHDESRTKLEMYGIDPDYYLSIPPEPDQRGLNDARQRLAGLQELREPPE